MTTRPRRNRKWEQHELTVINRAVIEGRTPKDIEHLLPGRTRVHIQNSLNLARKRLRGETSSAQRCAEQRADREGRVRQGLCCVCGNVADDGGTLTKCSECRHEHSLDPLDGVSPQQKNRSDLLPWIFSRVPGNLATHIPKDARKVVDLFAGSGRFARAANRRGFDVVYNDVHPLLAAYTKAVRDRDHAKINLAMTEMAMDITNFQAHYRNTYRKPTDLIEAAATARLAAFNAPRGCHLDETEIVKFAPLASDEGASAWANMEVSGLDYRKAIKEHDGRRTTFFVDCPYPGTDYYEHNMSWVEFKTMLRTVRGVRGDVLMVLPTQRRTVEMVADAGFHLHLRLLKTPRFKGRDLVASTRPLPVSDIMTPFDPAEFGLGSRAELDAEVDRVVAVLRDGGAMTRGQLEKALGISRSSTWGALSRARAEGRVVKKGRAKYTTASA